MKPKPSELLPCPFCGKFPTSYENKEDIWCPNIDCDLFEISISKNSWNTRPKSFMKWPDKLKYYYSKKTYPANCVEAANKMLAACQAAVEAAGLEYEIKKNNEKI